MLEKLQAEYVALHVADIRRCPQAYKATVVADPVASAWRVIRGLDETDMREMIRILKRERAYT